MKIHTKASLLGLLLLLAGCAGEDPSRPVARVVLVGIESLSREHVLGMVEKGELPNLARMMREGSQARVICPDPLQSPMLWSTLLTGQGAAKHRMTAEYVEFGGGVVCAPSSMRIVPSLFQLVSANRAMVASVGFPGTWPVEVVNGFNLTYGALPSRMVEASEHSYARNPGERAAFPPGLYRTALELYTPVERMDRSETAPFIVLNETEFEMLYDQPLGSIYRRENPIRDFALTLLRDRAQVELTEKLLADYPIRLAGVHLELAESLQLPFWRAAYPDHYQLPANSVRRFGKAVDECYRRIDDAIGRLVAAAGDDAVVCVVGNRGFGNVVPPQGDEGEPELTATISNETLMLIAGHGIARGEDLGTIDLVDIAPTLLTLLDMPVAIDMDGAVLEGALTGGFLSTHPRRAAESYADAFQNPARYPSDVEEDEEEEGEE